MPSSSLTVALVSKTFITKIKKKDNLDIQVI